MKRTCVVLLCAPFVLGFAAASAASEQLIVPRSSTINVGALPGAPASTVLAAPSNEIRSPIRLGSSPLRSAPASGEAVDLPAGQGAPTSSGKRAKSNPEVIWSIEGLNHRDSRLADNGNQFSGEPADQGLCAGNGFVLETVNSALRIYDAATGAPVSPTLSLNEFYGFPSAIDRTTSVFGPFTFDVSCHYDPDSNRWFHLAVDLDQDPATGAFTGRNFLDLAVSQTGDPTGLWNVYRIPAINDGTDGTPDHDCPGGPCFGDFPHLGVDRNGVYITTNEFPLFAGGFIGAQIYAMSKQALASGASSINIGLINTGDPANFGANGLPGFTLWPAVSAAGQFAGAQGGTNYFVSSDAVFAGDGQSNQIVVWALSNTNSLDSTNANVRLTSTVVPTLQYAVPPNSPQKDGTIPYGNLVGVFTPGTIDTGDSRVLDARYANGKLWAVLGTAAEVAGVQRTGVGWFVLNPSVNSAGVKAQLRSEGILAMEGESLAYPTLALTSSGRGVIGFSRVGENIFPSYGYASIDDVAGVSEVHLIREGDSPQDGFSEYGSRPRWGDYGAAAVDGADIYVAGQYIEQDPCTVTELLTTNCNFTRTTLANWSTRVTKLTP